MKVNQGIEALILTFVTSATSVLRKDAALSQGDAWKTELNRHVVMFVRMLRECLKNLSHVSPELLSRLDMYSIKLSSSPTSSSGDSGYETASSSASRARGESVSSGAIGAGLSMSVTDMTMVKIVAHLFHTDLQDVQSEIHQIKHFCTERVCARSILCGVLFDLYNK